MRKGMSSAHNMPTKIGTSDEWLTPPYIIKALGKFDLDPCSPLVRPWDTASQHITIKEDGLLLPWHGRVWMNPPYGDAMLPWLNKMAIHGNGIALTFARTDTQAFHQYVFQHASSIFFLNGRLTFYKVDGTLAPHNGGAPSVLISYGKRNMEAIGDSGLPGKHLLINYTPIFIIGMDRTWKTVVSMSIEKLNGEASLNAIYEVVEAIAPDKVRENQHHRAKVRQVLQKYFMRRKKGTYTSITESI